MMKKFCIFTLFLITAQPWAFTIDLKKPYSEENLIALAQALPPIIGLGDENFESKFFFFHADQKHFVNALSDKDKEQYYKLLLNFYLTKDLLDIKNAQKIASFADEHNLGIYFYHHLHGPAERPKISSFHRGGPAILEHVLVLPPSQLKKQLTTLSDTEKTEYYKLKAAADEASNDWRQESNIDQKIKLLNAIVKFERFEIKHGLAQRKWGN